MAALPIPQLRGDGVWDSAVPAHGLCACRCPRKRGIIRLATATATDTTLLYLYMSRSSAGKRLKLVVKLIEEAANSYGIMSLNSPIGDCRGAQCEVCIMCCCVQHRLVTWTSVDVFCQQSHCLLRGSTARLRSLYVIHFLLFHFKYSHTAVVVVLFHLVVKICQH